MNLYMSLQSYPLKTEMPMRNTSSIRRRSMSAHRLGGETRGFSNDNGPFVKVKRRFIDCSDEQTRAKYDFSLNGGNISFFKL